MAQANSLSEALDTIQTELDKTHEKLREAKQRAGLIPALEGEIARLKTAGEKAEQKAKDGFIRADEAELRIRELEAELRRKVELEKHIKHLHQHLSELVAEITIGPDGSLVPGATPSAVPLSSWQYNPNSREWGS